MYRLETLGYSIGQKLIEMISCRDRATKRETRLVGMLQYVSNVLWKHLFGKAADNLERSMENEDECRFHRLTLSLPRCISPPAHTQHPTPPPFLDCCRYDSRELTSNEHVRVCPRGYGPFELCCLHRGHHRRCLGQCTLRTSTPPLSIRGGGKLDSFSCYFFPDRLVYRTQRLPRTWWSRRLVSTAPFS